MDHEPVAELVAQRLAELLQGVDHDVLDVLVDRDGGVVVEVALERGSGVDEVRGAGGQAALALGSQVGRVVVGVVGLGGRGVGEDVLGDLLRAHAGGVGLGLGDGVDLLDDAVGRVIDQAVGPVADCLGLFVVRLRHGCQSPSFDRDRAGGPSFAALPERRYADPALT